MRRDVTSRHNAIRTDSKSDDDEEEDSESEGGSSGQEGDVRPVISKTEKRRTTSSPPSPIARTPPSSPLTTQSAEKEADAETNKELTGHLANRIVLSPFSANKEVTGMLIETLAGSRSSSMTVRDIWRTFIIFPTVSPPGVD